MINSESIQKLIRQFANQCPMVNDCNFGSVYDINTTENKFGLLNVELISCANKSNVMVYTYNIFYVDRLSEANSNKDQIWDDSVRAIKWLLNSLKSYDLAQIDIVSDYTFQFFSERFGDECAGAWVEVQLEAPNETGECFEDIKFPEPTLPIQSKSVTFDKNGIYQITPDEGYLLDLVEVKVDVNMDVVDEKIKEHNESVESHEDIREAIGGVVSELNNKVDKIGGKGLSTNDYTDADKIKLQGIEPDAFATKKFVEEAKKLLFIDMWNGACKGYDYINKFKTWGKYNKDSGFFELYDLKDITYEEALTIYQYGKIFIYSNWDRAFQGYSYRATMPMNTTLSNRPFEAYYMFYSMSSEYVHIHAYSITKNNIYFGRSPNLIKIYGRIEYGVYSSYKVAQSDENISIYVNCVKLEEIKVKKLRHNVEMGDCRNISKESILYMIKNADNTTWNNTSPRNSFQIKLHPDAYNRLFNDVDIVNAIAEKANVINTSAPNQKGVEPIFITLISA